MGAPVLIRLNQALMHFCHGLFERCSEYKGAVALGALWLGMAIVSGGLVYGLVRNLSAIIKARRAIAGLPAVDNGGSIVLIKDPVIRSAFTWGFMRPRIFFSTGLISSLTTEELRAVCLHETAHRRNADPLRFFFLRVIEDSFFYIPLIGHAAASLRSRSEFEADDYAAHRVGGLVTASALVKVSAFNARTVPAHASFAGTGAPVSRIERLLNGETTRRRPSRRTLSLSLVMAAVLAFAVIMPLAASGSPANACSTAHCSVHEHGHHHVDNRSAECKTHCKRSSHNP